MSLLHGLALFCGICLSSLGQAQSTGLMSPNMREDIKRLKDHFIDYSKKNKSSQPLFLKNPDIFDAKLKEHEKNLLVGEMLGVSEKILDNLMNRTRNAEMRMTILAVKGRVQELRKEYFPAINHNVQRRLQSLWAIKVDESVTQLQGLRELMEVYSKASNLGNEIVEKRRKRRRRRRQVLRSKMTQLL